VAVSLAPPHAAIRALHRASAETSSLDLNAECKMQNAEMEVVGAVLPVCMLNSAF
jgi:hypothetical protein